MSVSSRLFVNSLGFHQYHHQQQQQQQQQQQRLPVSGGGSPVGMSRNKDQLAKRLRQNWATRFPEGRSTGLKDANDELTNLGWLQNVNLMSMKVSNAAPALSPPASPPLNGTHLLPSLTPSSNAMANLLRRTQSYDAGLLRGTTDIMQTVGGLSPAPDAFAFVDEETSADYRNDPNCKPPYSYATLICMAMRDLRKNKITLADIYTWIMDQFMFYRVSDPSWQNSVRHNLSLNKCFQKVPRRKDEPGKGGFWRINPDYRELVESAGIGPLPNYPPIIINNNNNNNNNSVSNGSKRRRQQAEHQMYQRDSKRQRFHHSHSISDTGTVTVPLPPMSQWMGTSGRHRRARGAEMQRFFSESGILDDDDDSLGAGGHMLNGRGLDSSLNKSQELCMLPPAPATPPSSDSNDLGLEDLFPGDDTGSLSPPLDYTTDGDPLDLTVHGTGMVAPSWWDKEAAAAALSLSNSLSNSFGRAGGNSLAPSPLLPDVDQDWMDAQLDLEGGLDSILGLDSGNTST